MNKIKSLCVMVLVVLSLLAVSGMVSAAVTVNSVKINEDHFDSSGGVVTLDVLKDSTLDVKVTATSDTNIQDVQMSAYIRGNERDLVEDTTDTFDMKANVSYVKSLTLKLPLRMTQNTYTLYVRIENNAGALVSELSFSLEVDATDHAIQIKDIILSPENDVKAGRALLASVRVKNVGMSEEKDLKVKVTIPELGVSASDYINQLDAEGGADDSTTSEELYLRIPDCAEAGDYTVKACISFDDGDQEECQTTSIKVTDGDICPATQTTPASTESKTIITVGPETQDITAGKGAVYSVTLTNQGTESKSYTVSADGAGWSTISITPTNVVVLGSGESKTVMVNVAANANAAGQQMFSITINSGNKVLKQIPLKANVIKSVSSISLKGLLEIGLVVLVVLLVVLGLIIGFNKLKGNGEAREEKEETYY